MADKVYLFANGSQYIDWSASNCERCAKSVNEWDDSGEAWPTCELEAAIFESQFGDGSFDPDIARRIQPPEHTDRYNWPCGEVEWADWWIEEVNQRKAQQEAA